MFTLIGKLKAKLQRYDLVILLIALMVVVGTWGFTELTENVLDEGTHEFDELLLHKLRDPGNPNLPRGPRWLSEVARDITALGSHAVLALATAIVAGFLLLQRRFATTLLSLLAASGGFLLNTALKVLFARERPKIPHELYITSWSFPSGHAMLSAIIYLSLGALIARAVSSTLVRIYVIACSMGISFLVGISRVYLGVHYPTDVLAGWTAGLVWALLCWLLARLLQRTGTVERAEETDNP